MSQTFFSKQDPSEKLSRLSLLGSSRGTVTVWLKGSKDKHNYTVFKYDRDREEIVLDSKDKKFKSNDNVLCTFELRGMNFFAEAVYQESISGYAVLQVKGTLFKSERRNSYRLLTFPLFELNAEFDLGEVYEGGNVIDLKNRNNQTGLFKNFLKLVGNNEQEDDLAKLKIRVQDLSTTGMALHIGDLEYKYFEKNLVYQNVILKFSDETITIPEVKVVYVVDYIATDKNLKRYKVGLHFENLPAKIDDQIGRKINELLRQNDNNKDFENFLK